MSQLREQLALNARRVGVSSVFKSVVRNLKLIAICVGLGTFFMFARHNWSESLPAWSEDVLGALGGGFIALGGASVIYDHLVVNRSLLRMFKILGASTESEIEMIHAERNLAAADITEMLRNAKGTVRIMAIAMTDFLQGEENRKLLEKTSKYCEVKCLLLHPDCTEAKYRASKESRETVYIRTELFRNANDAVHSLKALSKNPLKADARFYQREPTLFLLMTDEFVLLEPYHLGADPSRDTSILTVCLGKHVPVMKFSTRSPLGVRLVNYFEDEWKRWDQDVCKLSNVETWIDSQAAPARILP